MAKKAIIVARDEACFQTVFGIPAIRRLVLTLQRAGVQDPRIMTINDDFSHDLISDLLPRQRLFTFNPDSDSRQIGHLMESLDLAVTDSVIVLSANTVIDEWSLGRLIKRASAREIVFSASGADCRFNCIYIVKDRSLPMVLNCLINPNGNGTPVVSTLVHLGGPGIPCVIDNNEQSVRGAEAGLVRTLNFSNKEHDSFLARHIDRPLARRLSQRIARTSIKPNVVTVINLLVGIAGAVFLAFGGYWNQLLGALLFLANVMGDGVDGDVARLKLKETPFGHYLDIISDNTVHIAVFIGIGIGLARQTSNPAYVYILPVLLGGFGICTYVINGIVRENSKAGKSLLSLLNNRDFAYLVVVLALLGRLNWFLVGSSAGVYLVALILLFLHFRSVFAGRTVIGNRQPIAGKKMRGD